MTWKPGELITKDPNSVEPQGFDWTLYLAELGDSITISSSSWSVSGPDSVLTLSNDSIVTGSLKTSVVLTAGTEGKKYIVTNRIVTNGSPTVTDDRSFTVLIQQK